MSTETKRILALTGTHWPKALVRQVDSVTGVLMFAWLNESEEMVDTGQCIARFAPVEVLPVAPETLTTYAEPDDATLITAILAA